MSRRSFQINRYRIIAAVLLFFAILALLRTGPALFSDEQAVISFAVPDTYLGLWGIWRIKNVFRDPNQGYFASRMLTYPVTVREPIAVYDFLFAILSLPPQFFSPSVYLAYNLTTALGLIFTGVSGYLLISWLSGKRAGGILGGVIMTMNPFLYRQLAHGFIEYAWWGIIPLTIWLYLKSSRKNGNRWTGIIYILGLFFAFLLSIYCACYLVITIFLITLYQIQYSLRERDKRKLKKICKIHILALLCLMPLFAFWLYNLSLSGFKGMHWKKNFSIPGEMISKDFSDFHSRPLPAPGEAISLPPPSRRGTENSEPQQHRVLFSSLDLYNLLSFEHEQSPRDGEEEPFPGGAADKVYGGEWILVVFLGGAVFFDNRERNRNLKWLGLGLFFLILAMGPFLTWKGRFFTSIGLPYLWFYKWIPGFSRLFVPARAFLITILALSLLAGRGLGILTCKFKTYSIGTKPFLISGFRVIIIALIFISLVNGRFFFPVQRIEAPLIYERIAEEKEEFALLEFPFEGDRTFRNYCQTIHGKPIFKGATPEFMTLPTRPEFIFKNRLVKFLMQTKNEPSPEEDFEPDIVSLRRAGFRYLLLHGDNHESGFNLAGKRAGIEKLLGAPIFEDRKTIAWRLGRGGKRTVGKKIPNID